MFLLLHILRLSACCAVGHCLRTLSHVLDMCLGYLKGTDTNLTSPSRPLGLQSDLQGRQSYIQDPEQLNLLHRCTDQKEHLFLGVGPKVLYGNKGDMFFTPRIKFTNPKM